MILDQWMLGLPSGKHTKNNGKSPFFMGKSTISMAIFNSYVCLPEGIGARSSGKGCAVSTCYVDENQSFQQQGLHETQQALLFVGNLLVAYVPFFTAILILSCFLLFCLIRKMMHCFGIPQVQRFIMHSCVPQQMGADRDMIQYSTAQEET